MAYKVPVADLMNSLQSAGVPFGDANSMQNAAPGLQQTIQGQVQANDTVGPQIKDTFMKQLAQVAQMDQKLGSVYSDPSSPLYTDNVMARERIISGAHSTNSGAAKIIAGRYREHQSELDKQVSDTVSLYKELTALQSKEEARAEKLTKEAARISTGKARYVTDETGHKVLVPVRGGGAKSLQAKVADSLARTEELRKQKEELAHLKDHDAASFYDNTPAKFQSFWLNNLNIVSNSKGYIPPKGYGRPELENEYNNWVKQYKPKTATELKGNSKIDDLKAKLGLQ